MCLSGFERGWVLPNTQPNTQPTPHQHPTILNQATLTGTTLYLLVVKPVWKFQITNLISHLRKELLVVDFTHIVDKHTLGNRQADVSTTACGIRQRMMIVLILTIGLRVEQLGSQMGGVLVGCWLGAWWGVWPTPNHAQTPIDTGIPRVFGGVLGELCPEQTQTLPGVNLDFTRSKVPLYPIVFYTCPDSLFHLFE